MRAVAKGRGVRMLAGAPGNHFGFSNRDHPGTEWRAFMRTIAERLALRAATGAPPVIAGLNFLDDWLALANVWNWIRHKNCSLRFP